MGENGTLDAGRMSQVCRILMHPVVSVALPSRFRAQTSRTGGEGFSVWSPRRRADEPGSRLPGMQCNQYVVTHPSVKVNAAE